MELPFVQVLLNAFSLPVNDLYSVPNIFRAIKLRRMRWAGM